MKTCVFIVVILVLCLCRAKFPGEKTYCLRNKTREKNVCRGRMIGLSNQMARVAEVDRGNFVCVFHWHKLRTRNNICSCPLPTHSATLSSTPIPERLYRVFDEEGRNMPSYRPGTRWCTSCRRDADKTFSSKEEYQTPKKRKRVGGKNTIIYITTLCRSCCLVEEVKANKILILSNIT